MILVRSEGERSSGCVMQRRYDKRDLIRPGWFIQRKVFPLDSLGEAKR